MKYAVGLDVGGTNLKCVAVDFEGKILAKRVIPIGDGALQAVAVQIYGEVVANVGAEPEVFGVAAPGIAARDGKSIWWMKGRLAELQGLAWSVLEGFRHRSSSVPVLNDAQAALLGEAWAGAAKGSENVFMLTLGTGVGGAAIVDGRLLRGHLGRAGHLGHVCLDPRGLADIVNTPGSLEEAIGDCTIERRSNGRFRSTADLLAADDADARRIWSNAVRALACGIASLVNVLDPEMVIIGGGMIAAGDKLFTALRKELDEVEWRPHGRAVRIVPAMLGEYAGAIGAAWNAINDGKL